MKGDDALLFGRKKSAQPRRAGAERPGAKQRADVDSAPDRLPGELSVTDLFCPDSLEIWKNYCVLGGDRYCRVYALQGMLRELQVGWLDEVHRTGSVDVSVHYIPAPSNEVVSTLLKKETQQRTQYELDRKAGNMSRIPELEASILDYEALRTVIQLGTDQLYYVTVLIAVHGADEEDLRRRCEVVESVLARKRALYRVLVYRQADGLKSVLPFGTLKVRDFQTSMTSGASMCCLPVTISKAEHASGVAIGYNMYTETMIFLDRFAGERVIPNQHLFISGMTGSGKSVTLRLLSLLEADFGVRTAFVDPENEYVHFVRSLDGQAVFLEPGKFSGMNVLDVEAEAVEEGGRRVERVNVLDKISDVQAWLAAVFRYNTGSGLGMRELALVEEALQELYQERGITSDPRSLYEGGVKKPMPTLSELCARLREKPGGEILAACMTPLLAGGTLACSTARPRCA